MTFAGIMQHVGQKIRQYRLIKGYSQQQLADLIHKGRPLISHIENTGKVNHETLMSICKVLGVTHEQITSVSEEPFAGWAKPDNNEILLLKAEISRLTNELKLKDEIISVLKAHNKQLKGKDRK